MGDGANYLKMKQAVQAVHVTDLFIFFLSADTHENRKRAQTTSV